MMQYNNLRRTSSPWQANALTLVALLAITFWSAQQRPGGATPFSPDSGDAQTQPVTVASAAEAEGIAATAASGRPLEAGSLHQIAYNPLLHRAGTVKR